MPSIHHAVSFWLHVSPHLCPTSDLFSVFVRLQSLSSRWLIVLRMQVMRGMWTAIKTRLLSVKNKKGVDRIAFSPFRWKNIITVLSAKGFSLSSLSLREQTVKVKMSPEHRRESKHFFLKKKVMLLKSKYFSMQLYCKCTKSKIEINSKSFSFFSANRFT